MNFTFLHCADLHLGSPMLGLAAKDPAVAERFALASREAFSDLVTRALEAKIAFAVISGDIFDGEQRDASIGLFFNREIARLTRAGAPVFIIKGNHDAETRVTRGAPLDDSVTVFSSRKFETHEIADLRVAVHGRSFPNQAVTENWALDYPRRREGFFNIGLLHTSCDGRPGHAAYAPCSIADMRARDYDYWALGHVHDFEILARDPWIVYPGNLQGRSIRECGARGAVLVEVVDGRVADVRRLIVDRARFALLNVDVSSAANEDDVLRAMRAAAAPRLKEADDRLLAARARLTGETPLHADFAARRAHWAQAAQAALDHLGGDGWLEKLVIETRAPQAALLTPALGDIDLAAALAELDGDEPLHSAALAELSTLKARLVGDAREEFEAASLDALLAEARALVLGRLGGASG